MILESLRKETLDRFAGLSILAFLYAKQLRLRFETLNYEHNTTGRRVKVGLAHVTA